MSRVTSKWQVTLHKWIRDELGPVSCSEVEFELQDGQVILQKKISAEKFARWRGYLRDKLSQGSVDTFLDDLRGEPSFAPDGPTAATEESTRPETP